MNIEKFKKLYIAANGLLSIMGAEGELTTRAAQFENLQAAMIDLDTGVFDVEGVFGKNIGAGKD